MLNIKNVVKSNKMMQVYDIASVTNNTGRCVELGVTTHSQYNSEVSMINYLKDTKYQKYTIYNHMLYIPTEQTLDTQ